MDLDLTSPLQAALDYVGKMREMCLKKSQYSLRLPGTVFYLASTRDSGLANVVQLI